MKHAKKICKELRIRDVAGVENILVEAKGMSNPFCFIKDRISLAYRKEIRTATKFVTGSTSIVVARVLKAALKGVKL